MPLKIPNWILVALLLLSLLGFLDAAYLTAKFYLGGSIRCPILGGCDLVTKSAYSEILGIPVSLLGAVFYLAIFLLSILHLDSKKEKVLQVVAYISPIGFVASLWLMYVQTFVLKAYCFYCVLSALISTLIFALGIFVWRTLKFENG